MNLNQSSIISLQNPLFFGKKRDDVDKGTNRSTPGTSGEGPRPPRKDEYPDDEDGKNKRKKLKKSTKTEGNPSFCALFYFVCQQ
ncbi:hypothetical protein [Cyclobacterium qasimii]|uniref:Uncharacterized protein n=1 Tax=Cyclobacterium qasimii M12-11B TaxID=641524 RepID=S7WJE1_9BACT|nr:hypothetical protein [Cyclobacterium qasimii]EPR66834.1 hypothetical protein ADICYQ_4095 [Cyclobacterium qasimii M12-11B]